MRSFYLLIFCLTTTTIFAQFPGGIGPGNPTALWLKADGSYSAGTWTDYSGQNNHFIQSTPALAPSRVNNTFNFYPALQFDGVSQFLANASPAGFPTASNDRAAFIVAKANATDGYRWILAYGNPGTADNTYQLGDHDGNLTTAYYASFNDKETGGYWTDPSNSNGGLASFMIVSAVQSQYNRGAQVQSSALVTPLFAPSANAVIGALKSASPVEFWSGSVAEIILFNATLSTADRNQVEAYLALKYGFTLGTGINYRASDGATVYWTASGAFQNDVFGIGNDVNTSLYQTQSNSSNSGNGNGSGISGKGNLVLNSPTALTNLQFLMIGNDAGSLAETTIGAGQAPANAVGSQRVGRNWKAQNTGSVGAVNLSFDMAGMSYTGGSTIGNYRLMIDVDGDGDYSTGSPVFVTPSSLTGTVLSFSNVNLPTGAVFTVITQASALLPAIWQGFNVAQMGTTANITWKTSDEVDVDYYSVEFSLNGTAFFSAGNIQAKNNGGLNSYSFTQTNLPAGVRYYRIKRVDKNGNTGYTDIKSIRIGATAGLLLKSNPVLNGKLELNIDVPQNQEAIIRVLNTSGQVLLQQNAGLTTGSNSISANISHIAAGTYFVQVQLGNDVINKKLVKMH